MGLKAGRSIDRDVVLVERYSEVIQSYKYAEKPQTPLMQVIEKCSPSKSRCKGVPGLGLGNKQVLSKLFHSQ